MTKLKRMTASMQDNCTIANKIVAPENVMLSSWLSVLHFNFLHIHMHLKKHILRTTVSIVYES